MKRLQTIIAIISVLIVAVAVILTAKYCGRAEEETTTTETITTSTEISTTEPITEEITEQTTTDTTTTEKPTETQYTPSPRLEPHTSEDGYVTPEFFRKHGVIYGNGYVFTWYSEKVLPGGGLDIPGRWSDGNYVRDEDGYIVMAHETLPMGTVIDSPFGEGKIYDRCPTPGVVDVYVSF